MSWFRPRNWLTDEALDSFGLNPRQLAGIGRLREQGRLTNSEYQALTGATKKTASRDLAQLTELGITTKIGATGRGVHYVMSKKGDKKGTKGT